MTDASASPEQRLYDAAVRWDHGTHGNAAGLIEAATSGLVDDLDSPSLRMLAGAHASDPTETLNELLDATLEELHIPRPGELPAGRHVTAGGCIVPRPAADSLRFEVRAVEESVGAHEVLVFVNGVEMTRLGAGIGMSPFDILIPENRLAATSIPRQIPIARCNCGVYGCGSTDATIVREGDVVHWEWMYEAPMNRGVTFAADAYDTEVMRLEADRRWERPEDTTTRLVLRGLDRAALAVYGLHVSWAVKDHANHGQFKVALFAGADDLRSARAGYQIFLRFRRAGLTPEEVARHVLAELARPPGKWHATWHSIKPGVSSPPDIASRRWRHERIG